MYACLGSTALLLEGKFSPCSLHIQESAARGPHDLALCYKLKKKKKGEEKRGRKASWLAWANELTGVYPGNIPE